MQEFIRARIKSLPPLSDTAIKVQQICSDPEGSLSDLSKVVQADPMLTANILKSANSPLYGFSREITTIERAVNLFGMVTVKGFALNAAMKSTFKIDLDAYGIGEGSFSTLCVRQNALASSWLARAAADVKRACIPASFLLEVGKLITSSVLKENGKHQEFKERVAACTSVIAMCELEREFVGFSSYEVTAMVFDKWALDLDMVEAIANIKEPENNVNSAVLGVILQLENLLKEKPEDYLKEALANCEKYNLDSQALNAAYERMQNA